MAAPLKVLVVEDEALLAMDIEAMIEDAGHIVAGGADSLPEVEALVAALPAARIPDLALVDIQLAQGTSGLDVAQVIRRHWADAVIVFVTANPAKIPADFAGGHGVIAKPFTRGGMISALHYLAEGMAAPPPALPPPANFTPAPTLVARWTIA